MCILSGDPKMSASRIEAMRLYKCSVLKKNISKDSVLFIKNFSKGYR